MEKDLKNIRKILKDLNYSDTYTDMLLKHIIEKFNNSDLISITPNFLYYALIYDEGKPTAEKIAKKYEDMRNPTF